jgi:hypothetical protein
VSLNYFPEPRPDELLYGLLARYARHLGLAGAGAASRLFGSADAVATTDLPCRLAALGETLRDRCDLSGDLIIDRHTLYPYHVAFQGLAVRRAVRASMLGSGRSIHLRLGVAASRVRRSGRLLFCRRCLAEMLERHGEATWRRAHQLPGVLVCPDHACPLSESTVEWSAAPRHGYVAATVETCPADAPPVVSGVSAVVMDRLATVARASASLLDGGAVDARSIGVEARRACLDGIGLMRSARKVAVSALTDAVLGFYGETLGHMPIASPAFSGGGWAVELARSRTKAFHPLLHVLFQAFVEGMPRTDAAFGRGPWECLNPLAPHSGDRVVTEVERRRDGGRLTGTFTCSCGYAYTRPLHRDGTIGAPRMKAYGPLLEPVLRGLLVDGASRRGVARAVGLDAKTMVREAVALGLELPWKPPAREPAHVSTRAPAELRLPPSSPGLPVRTRRPGHGPPGPRRDWSAVDVNLAEGLRAAAAAILEERPPVRLTFAELERRLVGRDWIRKRVRLLPSTMAAVTELRETTDAFRRRRIRVAVREFDGPGGLPAPWEVMRRTGVGPSYLPVIEAYLAAVRSGDVRLPSPAAASA